MSPGLASMSFPSIPRSLIAGLSWAQAGVLGLGRMNECRAGKALVVVHWARICCKNSCVSSEIWIRGSEVDIDTKRDA
ncbi:hypothetical protein BDQ12DRAFT_687064 [Crucibulum laeve]|uniref:Uncharacterized protein n=1 Tax=Crucibulum laeve TaxID=68775 RepID=A0A5C3M526_9AGAR|nr:hypothetical protein BDQ12DRAFT_687064 [Crucibulum laeve]